MRPRNSGSTRLTQGRPGASGLPGAEPRDRRTLMTRLRTLSILAAGLALAATFPAQAGPPLLCFPYEIGSAQSLPWGSDPFSKDKGYDRSHLVDDTVRLLSAE